MDQNESECKMIDFYKNFYKKTPSIFFVTCFFPLHLKPPVELTVYILASLLCDNCVNLPCALLTRCSSTHGSTPYSVHSFPCPP